MYRGLEVGLEYDPMLGKLIVFIDRDQDPAHDPRDPGDGGVHTSVFRRASRCSSTEKFVEGDFDTHFLEGMEIRLPEYQGSWPG